MMVENIKKMLYQGTKIMLPNRVFDFCWSKYYIANVQRNYTQVSLDNYYVKNKDGLKDANYCIFRFSVGQELFAVANKMIFYYEWAIANNFIPLVDIGYKEDFRKGKMGVDNLWEYCFQQPEELKLAFDKGNVLVSSVDGGNVLQRTTKKINNDPNDASLHAVTREYQKYYAKLNQISQKVWIFKPDVETRVQRTIAELFQPGMRVIGVVLREEFGREDAEMTAEQSKIYGLHPKALSLEETYKLVVEYMKKWNCTHVLITTMFEESLEYFKNKLGNKVIFVERKRRNFNEYMKFNAKSCEEFVKNSGENIKEVRKNYGESRIKREEQAISYAVEMAAVSKCNYCMGAKCSGLIAACILNGGTFEDIYIFEDKNKIQRY